MLPNVYIGFDVKLHMLINFTVIFKYNCKIGIILGLIMNLETNYFVYITAH